MTIRFGDRRPDNHRAGQIHSAPDFSVSSLAIVILPEADPDNEKQHLLQITIPHAEQRTIRNWLANGQINRLDFG
ncbi:MAG: hypothetical protein EBU88_17130 [Acidobacteria bacterium]|nr:hypothetical protein [Acidobacteriota bacterium]